MRDRTGRRSVAGLLAGTVAALGLPARGQAARMPLIGFLSSRAPDESKVHVAGFLSGLESFGYVDGQTATIEYRWASGHYDRLPGLARELVQRRPALIVAFGGTPSARAAKQATRTIPVLFVGSYAVSAGLVASLGRPGANVTGVDLMSGELGGKRLELLTQLVPSATTVGFLSNPTNEIVMTATREIEAAAKMLGKRLVIRGAGADSALPGAFAAFSQAGVKALVVQNDPSFDSWRDHLLDLANRHGIAAIYHIREFPADGGLMSYGARLADSYHQIGIMAGRILKGANVSDLPVERPMRVELVINLKAAKALGLAVPPTLLARADELIE